MIPNPMNKTVTLTEAQAKVVMQCLDLAVKNGGLNVAAVILPIAGAIESQIAKQPTQEETT